MKKNYVLLLALAIAACSSQSSEQQAGAVTSPDTTQQAAYNVEMVSDKTDIKSGSSEAATITVRVTDSSFVVAEGKSVAFSATGGVLSDVTAVTDLSGVATATLSAGASLSNIPLTVQAVVEGVTQTINVSRSGSSLAVSSSATVSPGGSASVTATLTDGTGAAIAGELISFNSMVNPVTPSSKVTDSLGQVVVSVGPGNSSEAISISALEGTVTSSFSLNVSGGSADVISFVTPADNASLAIGSTAPAPHTVTVNWTTSGTPVVGGNILFSVSKGDLDPSTIGDQTTMTVATDASGNASVQFLSLNDIGAATISAMDASDSLPNVSRTINFIATDADNMSVVAIPATVGTTSQSELVATVRDASNVNPIPNQTVLFSVSGSNGVLSQPSSITDLNGRASVGYTSGSVATTQNGVTVTATLASDTSINASTNMTVIQPSLSIVAGTGNTLLTIGELELGASYLVIVNDTLGSPVANAVVSVIARSITYKKGRFEVPAMGTSWSQVNTVTCNSEDANKNGVLDIVPGHSEDIDSDGKLDPAISVAIGATISDDEKPTISGGTITTDANGKGYFLMSYPRSHGNWQEIELEITASSGGSEAKAFLSADLLGVASDYTDVNVSPPGVVSPFGSVLNCSTDG